MKLQSSRRLKLRDVLILRVSEVDDDEQAALAELATNLSGSVNLPIIVLFEGMALESIPESDMAAAGWVRASSLTPVVASG